MKKYAVLFFFVSAAAASAQQLSVSDKLALRNNCKADVQKLCAGVEPGDGTLMVCMQENKDQLSQQCSDTIGKLMAKRGG